jgi:hypothetical protein
MPYQKFTTIFGEFEFGDKEVVVNDKKITSILIINVE